MGKKLSEKPVLAAIQEPPEFLNKAESIRRAADGISRAARDGADVIGFAECWVPGYPVWLDFAPRAAMWGEDGARALFRLLTENSVTTDSDDLKPIQDVVDRTGCHVVLGCHERIGGTLYNTGFLFAPNAAPLPHRKLVPTYTERLVWGRGDGSTLHSAETAWGTLGSLICWEHWMPFARAAMHAKNEAFHVCQWPAVNDIHQVASRHYAFEGRTFVIAAGSILSKGDVMAGLASLGETSGPAFDILASMDGDDSALIHNGGSSIVAPDGQYIAQPLYGEAGIVMAEANLDLIAEMRQTLDTDGHYSRPDIFSLTVNTRPQRGVNTDDGLNR